MPWVKYDSKTEDKQHFHAITVPCLFHFDACCVEAEED